MSLHKAISMDEVAGSKDKVKMANCSVSENIITSHKNKPAKHLLLIYPNYLYGYSTCHIFGIH